MKNSKTGRIAALGVAGSVAIATAVLAATPAQAEGTVLGVGNPDAISGEYIVVLNDGVNASASSASGIASEYGGKVRTTFSSINGFSADLSAAEARYLAADPSVAYVQQNAVVTIAATQDNPSSWGLDRIDQEALPLDNSFTYPDSAGEGVTAYIIDTGIETEHPDFEGRATHGIDTVDGDDDATDCQGHGTHVAGTVGGTEYGVAKNVDLVGVRVLDCNGSGTYEGVIEGIDWVTENATLPAVANMSLGGPADQAVNDAVEASVAAGVTYAVAAGNEYGSDACNVSPGGAESALTVAASDNTDALASFSNIGTCVDIIAPGVDITSAWIGGGEDTISGTSMASPHVAGAAALYLGENTSATPDEVGAALTENALVDVVTNPGDGTPNLLLNTDFLNV
ncbi:subtilisin family serine protease [Stackebrandtia endophytica]|uniref:Subtilisin family serine protease n=1 Tax=Stackebrandtia endophytica TaxID=1496996 RepID=A0A543AY47_9ACTN|nr:S8 family peptidase [Stackebrandtia endophytica]TQL77501.1 subtilisin family serine protease [Stackebrandtia endophytica]